MRPIGQSNHTYYVDTKVENRMIFYLLHPGYVFCSNSRLSLFIVNPIRRHYLSYMDGNNKLVQWKLAVIY